MAPGENEFDGPDVEKPEEQRNMLNRYHVNALAKSRLWASLQDKELISSENELQEDRTK